MKRRDHITPVLADLHWLPVEQRIEFKIAMLVFKCVNDLAPVYLSELVTDYEPPRTLRSSNSMTLVVPFTRSSLASDRAFAVAGPRLWNSLPDYLRKVDKLESFKKELKTILYKQAFES